MCDYFAACENLPNGVADNPIMGRVATCTRCATRMEQELLPFTHEEAESLVTWLEFNDTATFEKLSAKALEEMNGEVDEAEFWRLLPHIVRNDNGEVFAP